MSDTLFAAIVIYRAEVGSYWAKVTDRHGKDTGLATDGDTLPELLRHLYELTPEIEDQA